MESGIGGSQTDFASLIARRENVEKLKNHVALGALALTSAAAAPERVRLSGSVVWEEKATAEMVKV